MGHGAIAAIEGDWVVVDGGKLRTRAAHFKHRQRADRYQLQMDVVVSLPSGRDIVESFAGIGTDRAAALENACRGFTDCTFHALISALLQRKCEHAEEEVWDIGGTNRRVTMGMLTTRGQMPTENWPAAFEQIEGHVKASGLPKGLHWIRYFYAQIPGHAPVIEVLLDNESWHSLQGKAASIPWPQSQEFYSVRLFLIVQDI